MSKAVAAAAKGLDEARILRRITQRLADLVDGFVEPVVEVDEGIRRPKRLLEFLSCDHVAHVLEQHRQDLKRLLLELDLQALLAKLARSKIDLESPEADSAGRASDPFHVGKCLVG